MGVLFDQETVTKHYEKRLKEEARAEGLMQGMDQGVQKGMTSAIVHMFNDKKISAKEGAQYLGISVKKFLELVD